MTNLRLTMAVYPEAKVDVAEGGRRVPDIRLLSSIKLRQAADVI